MDKKEKEIQIALGTYLQTKWKEYKKLHAEGSKLHAEGYKLYTEGHKLPARGHKIYIEGNKICEEACLRFVNAIIEVYGEDMLMEWDGNIRCTLENGIVFE